MEGQSERRSSSSHSKHDKRSHPKSAESATIHFAPPPLPGQLGFDFDYEPNELREAAADEVDQPAPPT
jgi:hypothetical protein